MQQQEGAQLHPFHPMLRQWRTYGVTANCGTDWELGVIEQAASRGPHHSALDPENAATVKEDIHYQVETGF